MSRFDRWFRATAPAERLAVFRVAVGVFAVGHLVVRARPVIDLARLPDERWQPVGPLALLDDAPSPALVELIVVLTIVAGIAFVAGWRHRVMGPAFAVATTCVLTFESSWGQIFHTDNLVALHLLVLAVAPAADAYSLDARRRGTRDAVSPEYGWPLRLAAVLTVTTYVLAGIAKLRVGGLDWVDGDTLRNLVAHDNLRKLLLGDPHSPLGAAAVRHAWPFTPLAILALVVELVAPVALVRRCRTTWVAAAWAFHIGVLALMAVVFPYHLLGVAFAPLFELERLPIWLRRQRWWVSLTRRRAATGAEPAADAAI